MRFWHELRRRKVPRVAGGYAVVAWLLVEIAATVEPALGLPEWFDALVIALLALGFPIALVLAWAFELTPEGVRRSRTTADAPASTSGGIADVAILVALVSLLAFLGLRALRTGSEPAGTPAEGVLGPADSAVPAVTLGASRGAGGPSVAVLPFSSLSSDPEQEFFSDGLAEELLTHLARVDGLRVAGRTSSFAFKGRQADARTIGRELGVAHLLEGSVRRAGSRLRINALLVDVADGLEVWSGSYDRDLDDVFAIQEEIAAAVAEALSVTLRLGKPGQDALGTADFGAYEAYLQGQSLYYRAGLDPEAVSEALAAYERALEIDPGFGRAWIGQANASLNLGLLRRDWRNRAAEDLERAASRLLEIAPDAWETWVFQGYLRWERWDWIGAEKALMEAARRNPGDLSFWGDAYGSFLASVGRVREAGGIYQQALENDPLSMYLSGITALVRQASGDFAGAEAEYERSAGLDGHRAMHEGLRLTRLLLEGASVAEVEAQFSRRENDPLWGQLRRVWNRPEASLEVIRERIAAIRSTDGSQTLVGPALWASFYGDSELALSAMREAVIDRRRMFLAPIWLPTFARARAQAGFPQLADDVGLVEYWRTTGVWGDFCRPTGADGVACR